MGIGRDESFVPIITTSAEVKIEKIQVEVDALKKEIEEIKKQIGGVDGESDN